MRYFETFSRSICLFCRLFNTEHPLISMCILRDDLLSIGCTLTVEMEKNLVITPPLHRSFSFPLNKISPKINRVSSQSKSVYLMSKRIAQLVVENRKFIKTNLFEWKAVHALYLYFMAFHKSRRVNTRETLSVTVWNLMLIRMSQPTILVLNAIVCVCVSDTLRSEWMRCILYK